MRASAGLSWGPQLNIVEQLYKSLVLPHILYSLPVLHNLSDTNKSKLDCLCHLEMTRPDSGFGTAIRNIQFYLPTGYKKLGLHNTPYWRVAAPPTANNTIPGITTKSHMSAEVMRQLALEVIIELEKRHIPLYTDGSVSTDGAASAVYAPRDGEIILSKLSHKTSSTTTELYGMLSALRYIANRNPKSWVIFTDSQSAIETLRSKRDATNTYIKEKVQSTYGKLRRDGHEVTIQWIPSHYKIPGN